LVITRGTLTARFGFLKQITNYNWLKQNCYDKTIKTTISFYICLYFITTKQNQKQMQNSTTFFKRAHPNYNYNYNQKPSQHQQPTTNKLKKKPETAKNNLPPTKPSPNIAGNQNKPLDRN